MRGQGHGQAIYIPYTTAKRQNEAINAMSETLLYGAKDVDTQMQIRPLADTV